ncbi:MAG: (2Fe-2S)-binding protein [Pseudomonadota bacterium]
MTYTLTINGVDHGVDADPDMPLLWALRDILNMTGTKYGCGAGICGACAVTVDGRPERSCLLRVEDAAGLRIETIEQGPDAVVSALRTAWAELDVAQCGWCQSGQIVAASALLRDTPAPDDAAIDGVMDTQLCRCGTYARIRQGIHRASAILGGGRIR